MEPPGPGALHVWWTRPRDIVDPDLLERYAALLDDDERARHGRFLFARHRHLFLVARALVRVTLARYAGGACSPAALRFTFNEHGRPDLDLRHGLGALRFNLSHTDGLAVMLVGSGELGVDVENLTRRTSGLNIAEHFFAPPEVEELRAFASRGGEALAGRRFFDYWTLKEAYIKARGMGLAIPLRDFAYALGDGRRTVAPDGVRIRFSGTLASERPEQWSFRLLRPGHEHRVALALRQPPARPLELRCVETVPMIEDRPRALAEVLSRPVSVADPG
ncbi:MAG: 4'-phosphopantetheinyl transferase superfamily protein [Myxococcales bacterium]|nr:4'-phosphopantetheinyl transferase superfamily protein [Myxococcales bacterium]MCB9752618.1 4'-phosphopantetheinyl transferase superfamily protein [Myxococcales bacterium]